MAKYKTCPNCGTEHRQHIKICGCGHEWGESQSGTSDGIQRCCVCGAQGVWSDSVRGGGTWYCREHSAPAGASRARVTPKSVEQLSAEAREFLRSKGWERDDLRERSLAMVRSRENGANKEWALDLLEREQNGEKLLIIQRQLAREALGFPASMDCGEVLATYCGQA